MRFAFVLALLGFSSAALADAKTDYATYCATCHGSAGKGDGPAAAALQPAPADFSTAAFQDGRTDQQLNDAIAKGGPAVGKSPMMVAWGGTLSAQQVTDLVAYIRTLRAP